VKKEQEIPDLPASLSVHFREDLIAHIKNLPGEPFERQVRILKPLIVLKNNE
jgi:hypothetical protein